MKISEVKAWLVDRNINLDAISVAVPVNENGDPAEGDEECSGDGWFGTCNISGDRGTVYLCMAATNDNEIITFTAGDWLIGGPLGRIAGCF